MQQAARVRTSTIGACLTYAKQLVLTHTGSRVRGSRTKLIAISLPT